MNKKGFTLIELLAVIVVLGIVLVVTIPSIATSINNNKLSALNTLSKEIAKWYDEKVLEDKLSTNKTDLPNINNEWQCLGNIASLYGVSSNDIKLDGSPDQLTNIKENINIEDACSAIRIVNGSAEVILIGKPAGKYSKSNAYSYTISTEKISNFKVIE